MSGLTELETRVGYALHDPAHAVWTVSQIDEAIRLALHEYSESYPLITAADYTFVADGPVFTLAVASAVERVWFPYVNGERPKWVEFEVLDAANWVLCLTSGPVPKVNDRLRYYFAADQTIDGLDGALVNTLTPMDKSVIVFGAAGYCCYFRAISKNEDAAMNTAATPNYGELGDRYIKRFRELLEGGIVRMGYRKKSVPKRTGPEVGPMVLPFAMGV